MSIECIVWKGHIALKNIVWESMPSSVETVAHWFIPGRRFILEQVFSEAKHISQRETEIKSSHKGTLIGIHAGNYVWNLNVQILIFSKLKNI